MADFPFTLADRALAVRLARAMDPEGKIPRALDALGNLAGRDVLVLGPTRSLRAAQVRELGARVTTVPLPRLAAIYLLSQEQLICGVVCFLLVAITKLLQECMKLGFFIRRHLHADQDAPIVSPVIAIMEQADVPAFPHFTEKLKQRPGAFGKTETKHAFIIGIHCMSPDQVAHMYLGHLVICHVDGFIAMLVQFFQQVRQILWIL